jgi:hypothetical protein
MDVNRDEMKRDNRKKANRVRYETRRRTASTGEGERRKKKATNNCSH